MAKLEHRLKLFMRSFKEVKKANTRANETNFS